jgi:hypothetical protein
MFSAQEVVAMAAGRIARTWRTAANIDQFVARLALKDSDARDWVAVYESRKGIRVEKAPFTLGLGGAKRGAMFDPTQYYDAFDVASTEEVPPT